MSGYYSSEGPSRLASRVSWRPRSRAHDRVLQKDRHSVILVPGGAGYIGSHAIKALRRSGFEPLLFDNFSTGHRDFANGIRLVEGDLSNPEDLKRVFQDYRVDGVLHFAGKALVAESHRI